MHVPFGCPCTVVVSIRHGIFIVQGWCRHIAVRHATTKFYFIEESNSAMPLYILQLQNVRPHIVSRLSSVLSPHCIGQFASQIWREDEYHDTLLCMVTNIRIKGIAKERTMFVRIAGK